MNAVSFGGLVWATYWRPELLHDIKSGARKFSWCDRTRLSSDDIDKVIACVTGLYERLPQRWNLHGKSPDEAAKRTL